MSSEKETDRIADVIQRRLVLTQMVAAPMGTVIMQVMPLFALRIGANVSQLGVFMAIIWITDIIQFLVSGEVGRRSKRQWMVLAYLLTAIASAGYIFVASLYGSRGSSAAMALLFAVTIGCNMSLSLALAAWAPYIRIMVPLSATGRFLGRLNSTASAVLLAAGLLTSLFLGLDPPLWKFTLIFMVAVAGLFIRAVLVASLPADRVPIPPNLAVRNAGSLLVPLRDVAMVRFAVSAFLTFFLFWASRPLYTPFLTQTLAYPASMVVLTQTGLTFGMILFGRAVGRLADRYSYRQMIMLATSLGGLAIGGLLLLPRADHGVVPVAFGFGMFFTIGAAEAIVQLTIGRECFARSRNPHASEYLGLGNSAIGFGAAAGSLLGGKLPGMLPFTQGNEGLRWAFIPQAALLLLIAFALMWANLRTKRKKEVGEA